MTKHDACELAYKNGYEACRADMMNTVNALEGKIRHLEAERDALLSDVSDYQGNICAFCKNFKRIAHRSFCEHFDNLPMEDGVPLMCGKWEWRGVKDDTE